MGKNHAGQYANFGSLLFNLVFLLTEKAELKSSMKISNCLVS